MATQQGTKEATKVNGVDVEQLTETLRAIRRDPKLAAFQFRARNRWQGGTLNRTAIKEFSGAGSEDGGREQAFVLDNDEPPVLLGRDRAANPVEYALHALAGCMTTTMVCHAAARGIAIESVESQLEGDIDVRGFMGLSDDVRKGYREIRVTFRVKSDASPAQLEELVKFSPMFDTISNPVRVTVAIEKKA